MRAWKGNSIVRPKHSENLNALVVPHPTSEGGYENRPLHVDLHKAMMQFDHCSDRSGVRLNLPETPTI